MITKRNVFLKLTFVTVFATLVMIYVPSLNYLGTTILVGTHNKTRKVIQATDFRNSSMKRDDYHTEDLKTLGDVVQRRLNLIQNPSDCHSRRKLVCKVPMPSCGFGCKVNSICMCLMLGYALNRTVVLVPSQVPLLMPISLNYTKTNHRINVNSQNKTKFDENHENELEIVYGIHYNYKPEFFPPALPDDLAHRISQFHDDPFMWWAGQMAKYIFIPNKRTHINLEKEEANLGFSAPTAGIHVRRTDKVLMKEAELYDVSDYMTHVEQWYVKMESVHPGIEHRVFVATDDPTVVLEIKQRYPGYTVLFNNTNILSTSNRQSREAKYGVVHDVYMLSRCDFIVCTYSSNLCRFVAQLMQARLGNVTHQIVSLDLGWYFYGARSNLTNKVVKAKMPQYEDF